MSFKFKFYHAYTDSYEKITSKINEYATDEAEIQGIEIEKILVTDIKNEGEEVEYTVEVIGEYIDDV